VCDFRKGAERIVLVDTDNDKGPLLSTVYSTVMSQIPKVITSAAEGGVGKLSYKEKPSY